MNIYILTLPFTVNYGGILQGYALQTALTRLGHDVKIIHQKKHISLASKIKRELRILVGYIPFQQRYPRLYRQSDKRVKYITKDVKTFIHHHIRLTDPLNLEESRFWRNCDIQTVIVGSDQVWRPKYAYPIQDYFLAFIRKKQIKKIAYAASFGTDRWEFSDIQTKKCKDLIKNFTAVSIREDSGINLCREHLDVEAVQVLDPTLLLNEMDYINLIEDAKEEKFHDSLFCYILDESGKKDKFIRDVIAATHFTKFNVKPEWPENGDNLTKNYKKCLYPSITKWLRAFYDAEMIITDSFHGCVFSIIFKKPFWVIGNAERGMARFKSLLSLYGLEHRLVNPEKFNDIDLNSQIDWSKINEITQSLQKESISYLIDALAI